MYKRKKGNGREAKYTEYIEETIAVISRTRSWGKEGLSGAGTMRRKRGTQIPWKHRMQYPRDLQEHEVGDQDISEIAHRASGLSGYE